MIRVVKFEPEHVAALDLLEVYNGDLDLMERVRSHASSDLCLCNTLVCPDGSILGVVGMTFVTDGYSQMWSVLSKKVNENPVGFHKVVGGLINHFWDECNLYRIDTRIDVDNVKAQKQNELWGLSRECLLKKSGPTGRDEYVYSRVR